MPSPQVVVVATVEVKSGSEDAALAALETAITQTHAEDGNIAYALHRDYENPQRFVMVETWASKEALEEHFTKSYLADLFGALGELVSAPPVIMRTLPIPLGDAEKGAL